MFEAGRLFLWVISADSSWQPWCLVNFLSLSLLIHFSGTSVNLPVLRGTCTQAFNICKWLQCLHTFPRSLCQAKQLQPQSILQLHHNHPKRITRWVALLVNISYFLHFWIAFTEVEVHPSEENIGQEYWAVCGHALSLLPQLWTDCTCRDSCAFRELCLGWADRVSLCDVSPDDTAWHPFLGRVVEHWL